MWNLFCRNWRFSKFFPIGPRFKFICTLHTHDSFDVLGHPSYHGLLQGALLTHSLAEALHFTKLKCWVNKNTVVYLAKSIERQNIQYIRKTYYCKPFFRFKVSVEESTLMICIIPKLSLYILYERTSIYWTSSNFYLRSNKLDVCIHLA